LLRCTKLAGAALMFRLPAGKRDHPLPPRRRPVGKDRQSRCLCNQTTSKLWQTSKICGEWLTRRWKRRCYLLRSHLTYWTKRIFSHRPARVAAHIAAVCLPKTAPQKRRYKTAQRLRRGFALGLTCTESAQNADGQSQPSCPQESRRRPTNSTSPKPST